MSQLTRSTPQNQLNEPHGDDALAPGDTPPGANAPVSIQGLSKTFKRAGGSIVKAVDDVDLLVEEEEIVVLLGPSGCGKTTLLRCIAGLELPSHGTIHIGGDLVFEADKGLSVPPNKRDVNMMFQSYALWPHMTLEKNVAFPLRIAGMNRAEALAKANDYLSLVGLDGLGRQYAANISGGQQQRVALARTLVSEPAVVLFDEPLSNVDAKVRAQLRGEILRLHSELKFAAVYVTHDQTEAMALGDRLAVMDEGTIAQCASPVEVYGKPSTSYVAQFIGEANMLKAELREAESGTHSGLFQIEIGEIEVVLPPDFTEIQSADEFRLMIRPEACLLSTEAGASGVAPNTWPGVVKSAVFAGSQTEYICTIGGIEISIWRTEVMPLSEGTEVSVTLPADSIRIITP